MRVLDTGTVEEGLTLMQLLHEEHAATPHKAHFIDEDEDADEVDANMRIHPSVCHYSSKPKQHHPSLPRRTCSAALK